MKLRELKAAFDRAKQATGRDIDDMEVMIVQVGRERAMEIRDLTVADVVIEKHHPVGPAEVKRLDTVIIHVERV